MFTITHYSNDGRLILDQENIGLGKIKQQKKATDISDPPQTPSGTRFSFSSLPSSFTTLLLSLFDSPAYACLTTHFLENEFNPSTPNSPNVKYYSVSGRISSVNVLHPFWLPKMVVDEAEQKFRQQLRDEWEEKHGKDARWPAHEVPLWANEDEWGNDGLVSIQSAKWGEYLGVLEESDRESSAFFSVSN